jgi:glycerol-3-phosphate acyltransferase PlsY
VSGLLDVGKGIVSVLLAIAVGGGLPCEILAALAAIVGHSRSIWIGFGAAGDRAGVRRLIVIARSWR